MKALAEVELGCTRRYECGAEEKDIFVLPGATVNKIKSMCVDSGCTFLSVKVIQIHKCQCKK